MVSLDKTVSAEQPAAAVTAPAASAPADSELDQALMILYDMGIEASFDHMKAVLEKYNYNVQEAVSELLG